MEVVLEFPNFPLFVKKKKKVSLSTRKSVKILHCVRDNDEFEANMPELQRPSSLAEQLLGKIVTN